ncbi:MAG: S41 family peptidase, partial [Myxococcota bacterium]
MSGCLAASRPDHQPPVNTAPDGAPPVPPQLNWMDIKSDEATSRLSGVWRNQALGHVAIFNDGEVEVFHEYSDICIADTGVVPKFSLVKFDDEQQEIQLQYYDFMDRPTLLQKPLTYVRLQQAPPGCLDQSPIADADRVTVFDLVWAVFDQHYAFFEQRGVDWDRQRALFRPRAASAETDEELFYLLSEMIRPLNDGHVNLTWRELFFNTGRPDLRRRLGEAWAETDRSMSEGAFVSDWSRTVRASALELLDENTYRADANGALEWGVIGGNVGYLRINRFSSFHPDAPSRPAELDALGAALSRMSGDLKDTARLILDVSHNGGGNDAAAMTVVEHFLDVPRDVLVYRVAGVPDRIVRLVPSRDAHRKPITLLTSEITASAAEAFVLMMRALPNVEHAGGATRGGISSLLPKPLPRGFRVTVAHEQVRDVDGFLFEGEGIPPKRKIELYPEGQLYDGYARA